MSDVTVGRAQLGELTAASIAGDILTISGRTGDMSAAQGLVVRESVFGLVGNVDDPVVPVRILDGDARLDGWYEPIDGTAVPDPGLSYRGPTPGHHDWTLQLRRLGGDWQAARREWLAVSTPLSNPHGIPDSAIDRKIITVDNGRYPRMAGAVRRESGAGINGTFTVDATGNSVRVLRDTGRTGSTQYIAHDRLPLGEAYDLSATIEVMSDDGSWVPAIGRSFPIFGRRWRISNGLVRFEVAHESDWNPVCGRASYPEFGSWVSGPPITIGTISGGNYITANSVESGMRRARIVRNSPDIVTVSVLTNSFGKSWTVRRGSLDIEVRSQMSGAYQALSMGLAASSFQVEGVQLGVKDPASRLTIVTPSTVTTVDSSGAVSNSNDLMIFFDRAAADGSMILARTSLVGRVVS